MPNQRPHPFVPTPTGSAAAAAANQNDQLSLKQLVTKVHELKHRVPQEAEIKTLADVSKPG